MMWHVVFEGQDGRVQSRAARAAWDLKYLASCAELPHPNSGMA